MTGTARQHVRHPPGSHWRVVMYHYSMGHIHESVLETDVAALRLQSVRYYYLCPKY